MSDIDMKQVLISSDPSLLDLDAIVHFCGEPTGLTSVLTKNQNIVRRFYVLRGILRQPTDRFCSRGK